VTPVQELKQVILKKLRPTWPAIKITKPLAIRKIGTDMSKMSDLTVEISDMLEAGYLPVTVARLLEIPVNWVYETADPEEELSPFQTVNS